MDNRELSLSNYHSLPVYDISLSLLTFPLLIMCPACLAKLSQIFAIENFAHEKTNKTGNMCNFLYRIHWDNLFARNYFSALRN